MSRTDRTRRKLLDAAVIEFEAEGVEGASMDAIARRAGLTRATVYNHYANKAEIADVIVRTKVAEWSEDVGARLHNGEDPFVVLIDALTRNAQTCIAYPRTAQNVLTDPKRYDAPPSLEGTKSFRHLVRELVELNQANGVFRDDLAADYLVFMILGLHVQYVLFHLASKMELPDGGCADVLRQLCAGINGEEAKQWMS